MTTALRALTRERLTRPQVSGAVSVTRPRSAPMRTTADTLKYPQPLYQPAMPQYIVGVDRLYQVTAKNPDEAESQLADMFADGEIHVEPSDCVTYEELPEQ